MAHLERRLEEMTMAPGVVILLVILGAGAVVVIGWAITHNWRTRLNNRDMNDTREAQLDQCNYMRDVRFRNKEQLSQLYGYRAPSIAREMDYYDERDDERDSAW